MTGPTHPTRRRRTHIVSPKRHLALLGAIVAVGAAMPAGTALAEGAGTRPILSVRGSGHAVALLPRLTFAQLAAILQTSPAGLAAQIQAETGSAGIGLCVSGLVTNPVANVGELNTCLIAGGLEPAAAEALVEHLLAPLGSNGEGLRQLIATILEDLKGTGELEAVAVELGVPAGELATLSLTPSTVEGAAGALGAGVQELAEALKSAGAIASPIGPAAQVVTAPVAGAEGRAVELLGTLGSGGPSLTTIYNSTATPTTVVGNSSASVDNAFTIVSIKLNRAGSIVETVRVPRAGRLSISANGTATIARRSGRPRHVGVRVSPRAGAIAAGRHSFTLRARPGLAHARRSTLSLVTSFKPTGGTAYTKHKTVTFRRPTTKGATQR
jgi:hypothetical protein